MSKLRIHIFILLLAILFSGCSAFMPPKVEIVTSPNLTHQYKDIMVFPFIASHYLDHGMTIRPDKKEVATKKLASAIRVEAQSLNIMPPIYRPQVSTNESIIFDGLIKSELLKMGFAVREGLFENKVDEQNKNMTLTVSLDLINEVTNKYGVKGIIIGDIVFDRDSYYNKLVVTYVQARLIDTKTLEIMKTVTYAYKEGETMDKISKKIAEGIRNIQ